MDQTTPRRGRPPKHSRERIIAEVTAALEQNPDAPLTIAWISDVTGIAPMSLYRHFEDRDDLVRAVALDVFYDSRPAVPPDATWQDEIAAWMRHIHQQSLQAPALVRMAASGSSQTWTRDSTYLARVLMRAGFEEPGPLAEAVQWVSITTMGYALAQTYSTGRFEPDDVLAAVSELPPEEDRELMTTIVHQLAELYDDRIERAIRFTVRGLEGRLADLAAERDATS
jgi:AcrR family transcriptional regulator